VTPTEIHATELIQKLRVSGSRANIDGMKRFGIATSNAFGTGMPFLRGLAKQHKFNHALAQSLWESGWHEARILASLIDDPKQLSREQMERWVKDFDSWDVTDQCCMNLFRASPFALDAVREWSGRDEEFVKRAAFSILASLAVHNKEMSDEDFIALLPLIEHAATDERNFVKKSVNWALRQIGKRSMPLHNAALDCAERLLGSSSRSARWIARDALRELRNERIMERVRSKKSIPKTAESA
jgi:3-methyladenine DNA glycosylase AlkD